MKSTILVIVLALCVGVGITPASASSNTHTELMLRELAEVTDGKMNEVFYSDIICKDIFGGSPTTLKSGREPDCETAFTVMEFDWGDQQKLYQCIGQAIAYRTETGKTGVCIVLAKSPKQLKKGIEFIPIFNNAGIGHMLIPVYNYASK